MGDGKSIHIERWVLSLYQDYEIGLFSLRGFSDRLTDLDEVKRYSNNGKAGSTIVNKLSYLKTLPTLKKALEDFKPSIIHAHYASSYGLLGRLVKKDTPLIISCWGSDLFEFPLKSFANRILLKKNLQKADLIQVSSLSLKEELGKYSKKQPELIYFGVDTDLFKIKSEKRKDVFVLGQAKALSSIYGIDRTIKVLSGLKKEGIKVKLKLAGEGEQKEDLLRLAKELGVENEIDWLGHINHSLLDEFYEEVDLGIYLSRAESFGVSAIECMSKGIPVVVSSAPGLSEVVDHNQTGLVFDINDDDITRIVKAVKNFVNDEALTNKLGVLARNKVENSYVWENSVECQKRIYNNV